MNTYDPADYIHYVLMDRTATPSASSVRPAGRLPVGYANESPRTRLRRWTADRPPRSSDRSLLEQDPGRVPRAEAARIPSRDDVAFA